MNMEANTFLYIPVSSVAQTTTFPFNSFKIQLIFYVAKM